MGLVKKVAAIGAEAKKSGKMDEIDLECESIDENLITTSDNNQTICRICARSKSKTNLSYISVDQIDKLKDKLMKYLNIEVTRDDSLPKSICIKCFRMLNLFHEFVLMSKESQKILKMGCTDKADVEKDDNLIQTNNNNNIESVFNKENIKQADDDEEPTTSGFDCDRCWFHCKDKKELDVHKKTHKIKDTKYVSPTNELFNFICDKCPAEMCNWEQYKRHYWYNHTYEIIKCKYEECKDLTFQNRPKLRKHIQMKHVTERPTCFFCNKKYSCKLTLVTHIKNIHQKCRNKKCSICGKCFQTNYNLKTHMRTHTRIAQFSCPECTRPFVYKHIMKRHCEKVHGYTLDGRVKQ